MKKIVLFAGIACAIPFHAFAATIACSSGTLASYISLSTGCAVNDQRFFGFAAMPFTPGTTINLTPAAINITPITSAGMPGLLFTLNASAGANQLADAAFAFAVTPDVGSPNLLSGSRLTQNGGAATLDGNVVGTEMICLNSAFTTAGLCPTNLAARNLGTFALDGLSQNTDVLTFATARSLIGVNANFSADGGFVGTAGVTSFAVQFSTTPAPEPSTFAALTGGMLCLFVFRKRFLSISTTSYRSMQ